MVVQRQKDHWTRRSLRQSLMSPNASYGTKILVIIFYTCIGSDELGIVYLKEALLNFDTSHYSYSVTYMLLINIIDLI